MNKVAVIIALALLTIPFVYSPEISGDTGEMEGNGTDQDPFLVSSVADLKNIGKGRYSMSSSYRQVNDIVFTDNDALNKDDVIRLEIMAVDDKIIINIFWNDEPLNINANGVDYFGITFNSEDKLLQKGPNVGLNPSFEFSKESFVPKDENVIILRGFVLSKNLTFGMATKFYDLPFETSECVNGNFMPIGTEISPFSGKYDGGNFSIKGLKIVSTSDSTTGGLFSTIVNSEISNIELKSGDEQNQNGYVICNKSKILLPVGSEPLSASIESVSGGIVGVGRTSTLLNLKNENVVASYSNILVTVDGDWVDNIIKISIESESSVGGIAGIYSGKIINCENRAYVSSISYISTKVNALSNFDHGNYLERKDTVYNNSGGIVGKIEGGAEIKKCNGVSKIISINTMDSIDTMPNFNGHGNGYPDLTFQYYHRTGGIAGSVDSAKIMNSFYNGNIQTSSNIFSSGPSIKDMSARMLEFSGGIFGNVMNELYCLNCYSIVDIKQSKIQIAPTENQDEIDCQYIKRRGGIIGWFGGSTLEIKTSFSENTAFSNLDSDEFGGIIGYSPTGKLSLIDVYYSKNGVNPIGGRNDLEIEKYSKEFFRMNKEDYGENWDFERIWDIDEDTALPVLRLRFYVQFVSDVPFLYDIIFFKRAEPKGFLVDDVRQGFSIELSDASSRSVPHLQYDDGDPVTQRDGEYFTFLETDEDGTPVDKTIMVMGVSLNRYSINIASLPEAIDLHIDGDGSAEHGSDVGIRFTSDTYDVSRLTFTVSNKGSKVISNGEGTYTITNITNDTELFVSGFAERPDLASFILIITFTCIVVCAAILIGMVKLIRMRSHTRNNEQTR